MALPEQTIFTAAEYLAFDRRSDIKHEFAEGEIYAMTGASWNHNLISLNIAARLNAHVADKPCFVMSSDMRVQVKANRSYRYPDVVVVCGEPQFMDEQQDTLLNPVILIEILSPSTALIDRNDKLREYRQIPSVQEYLLAAQDQARVERYLRQDAENWLYTDVAGLDKHIELPSIACMLSLSDIYAKVTFSEDDSDSTSFATP